MGYESEAWSGATGTYASAGFGESVSGFIASLSKSKTIARLGFDIGVQHASTTFRFPLRYRTRRITDFHNKTQISFPHSRYIRFMRQEMPLSPKTWKKQLIK